MSTMAPTAEGLDAPVHDLPGLLQRLTALANTTSDLDWGLQSAVREVRASFGSAHARAHRERDGVLEPVGEWDPAPPPWPVDATALLADVQARSRAATAQVHVEGADVELLAVPVPDLGGDRAVLVFVSTDREPRIGRHLDVLDAIGVQLGLVAARQSALDTLAKREHELHRSNAELERFAYVASHDLQEPLRKVVTACELLERRYGDLVASEPGAGEYLQIAVDAAHRMQTLIRDLLTFSRVGRGDRPVQAVDLGALVDEVVADLVTATPETTVEVGALPCVLAEPGELRQAVANVLSNAVKFRSDAAPHLVVAAAPAGGDLVEVTVTDNGIGIPAEYAEQVFEVFRRLHRQDQYPGTGVGLAIVRRAVERLGGRVWVSAPQDGGTRVHLVLRTAEGAA